MKRILIMLSVLILAIGFSACGKKSVKDISSDMAESAASDTFIEVEPTGNETNNEPPTSGNVADGTVTVSDAGSSASAGKQHPAHTYKKAVVPATCENIPAIAAPAIRTIPFSQQVINTAIGEKPKLPQDHLSGKKKELVRIVKRKKPEIFRS